MREITFLVPVKITGGHYGANADRLELLIQSLRKFFRGDVENYLRILCPDNEASAVRKLVGDNIEVITDSEMVPGINSMPSTNWMKQQFLKLSAALNADTPFTMTLDPDNFATRSFGVDDLIKGDRALIDFCSAATQPHWWNACAKMIGFDPGAIPDRVMHVTPCIYSKQAVQDLKDKIESDHGKNWLHVLLRDNKAPDAEPLWIENGIYYFNLYRKQEVEKYHFTSADAGVEPIHNNNELWLKGAFASWDASACFDDRSRGLFAVAQSNTFIPPSEIGARIGSFIDLKPKLAQKTNRSPKKVPSMAYANFLEEYEAKYASKSAFRAPGFRAMFKSLLNMNLSEYTIVETGCSRKVDGDNIVYGTQVPENHPWYPTGDQGPWADGQSTFLFDQFVQRHKGNVYTVDIDPVNCHVASENSSDLVTVTCQDSVTFLRTLAYQIGIKKIDLLFLDSYDLDWYKPHDSGLHHIKELISVVPYLRSGTIIGIDDNRNGDLLGKGIYVIDYLKNIGATCLEDSYQGVWIWP